MTVLLAQEKQSAEKRPQGRPAFEPTPELREQAQNLSGYGVPHDQIAALLGVSDETLRKYFGPELKLGKAKANSAVGSRLWQKAMEGDVASMIWWSKAQMRWREETNVQAVAPVTINLAWLPGRGVDAGYSTYGAQIIDAEAQPIEYIEQKNDDLRVTDTMGEASEALAVENDPLPPRSSGGGGGR